MEPGLARAAAMNSSIVRHGAEAGTASMVGSEFTSAIGANWSAV